MRTVTLHVPVACAVPDGAYARYFARGDFQPLSSAPAEDDISLSNANALLEDLPAAARSLVVDVSDDLDSHWLGVGGVPDTGDVDVLLWPVSEVCGLSTTIPGVADPAFGAVDARRVIVSGGRALSVSVVPSSWIVDLGTGRVTEMVSGPLTVRERATLTPFGNGALLAGGVRSDDPNGMDNTAEVWDSAKGDFDGMRIPLSTYRAEHGAVQLASGDVLLVGGIGQTGKPLGVMEIVSLKDRRGIPSGLPVLEPRTQPILLRLASGEIVVAGGKDANGKPTPLLEILSADAHKARRIDFVARPLQSFVALDGGGALFIVAPASTDPPDFRNVYRLTGDGALLTLPQLATPFTDVRAFPASGGGAIVWTGAQWLAFEPWNETFTALPLSTGPTSSPAIAPESGLPIWLSTEAGSLRVNGRRFSIRNQYATEILPLATLDRGPIVPDRSPSIAGMTFDAANGLFLPDGSSAFVADGRYADFVLDATVLSNPPPVVVLRDASGATYEIGGKDCPLATTPSLHIERIGAAVGVGSVVCAKPLLLGRVAIGFQGRGGSLQNIRPRRMVN
jgi:hypothetical protein